VWRSAISAQSSSNWDYAVLAIKAYSQSKLMICLVTGKAKFEFKCMLFGSVYLCCSETVPLLLTTTLAPSRKLLAQIHFACTGRSSCAMHQKQHRDARRIFVLLKREFFSIAPCLNYK
jgi:hypothetical protein